MVKRRRLAWVAVVALVASCSRRPAETPRAASSATVYHRVKAGQTLSSIGKAYGVPYQRIAHANGIRDPSRIDVGQMLLIPDSSRPVTPRRGEAVRAAPYGRDPAPPSREEADADVPQLRWPVGVGTVTSGFGPRGGTVHDGIDIAASHGAPVLAAADGEVIFSATLPGYGNTIILRHAGGYATVYAHNAENRVAEGARVRQGHPIAAVGASGRTTGPNLHFEVRRENIARNPLYFLPAGMPSEIGRGMVRQEEPPRTSAGGG